MKRHETLIVPRPSLLAALAVALLAGGLALAPLAAREDPAKIVGAEACGECHVAEYEVWKKTPHATGFKTLHRKASAEAIRDRLGLRLVKRDSPCLDCHYTATEQSGQLRAVSGVSCESCHGAGRDYLDVHNDYGAAGDHASETPEHRARRIEASRQAGMRRPSDLYGVASSCYGCHTVPNERLVNVGGHSIGSGDFELVEWSQGEIRHNFLDSFLEGDGAVNAERGPEQRRRMYVAGRAAELEHALRGVAAATEEGTYLKAMQRRVRGAVAELRAVSRRADLAEIDAMLAAVRGADVKLGAGAGLARAADEVAGAARRFLDGHDGTALASLDPLVLGIDDEPGDDEAGDDEATVAAGEAGEESESGTTATPGATPGAAATATSTAAAPAAAPRTTGAVPAVGEVKRRIRPPSRFDTLGPGACGSCHAPQNQWWFDDAHFASADPFFDEAPEAVRIARLYGIRPSEMTRGDKLCMDCHGSVVSGRERRAVQDGVGCEGCHGPAAEYRDPHQEGDKALGARRPGYVKALELGMTELRDARTRARTCAGCHYVTDPRLISAGHPSGARFDYLAGMARIRHWENDEAEGALRPAFAAVLAERGPVPEVQRARLGVAAAEPAAAVARRDRSATPASLQRQLRPRPARGAFTSPGRAPVAAPDEPPPRSLALPPFPELDASASVEEVLHALKERFELLYREIYRPPGGPGP